MILSAQKEPDLQHSTNPPAPPLPAELVPAPPKTQTADNTVTTQSEDKVSHRNLFISVS